MADTTPAPIGEDALREALWICVEHNALHFGETHNTVVQGRAALATAAQPPAGFVMVPIELAKRVQETMGEFLMDHGWRQQDMDTSDEFGALLAVATKAAPARWYMINAAGMATLCADKQDAEQAAADAQAMWPHAGPHRAVQMLEVAAAPAPAAQGDALDQGVREELSIGKAINRAARDLPEGWEIRIDLERHAGVVFLIDPDGNETMSEGGELFSDQINAAIDAAIAQQEDKSGANHDL